jgi:(R,R)-butanediol dehydrogenase/meso-butanediol dehydrogenase/diacetyl reductase/L-iditol 2-dehydrogenase
MKTAAVTKIGSLKDPDASKRGKVETIDFPEQELDPQGVKIKVAYCAICGSDPHLAEGVFGTKVPIGIGHELSGIVEALGAEATKKGLKVGDRIACDFRYTCGTCYYCLNGQAHFCSSRSKYMRPGMAEYVIWHESQVYKLPESVSLLNGSLLEPLSIAVHMTDQVSPKLGGRVAVSGGGPIGQLVTQCMTHYGATSLTMIEPVENRRELAKRFGAKYTIDPINQDVLEEAKKITNGLGFDVVVDVSGAPAAAEKVPPIAARGGTILFGAMYPVNYEMPFNLYKYCYFNELTIVGSFLAPYAFPRTLQLLAEFDLAPFTEQVYPLEKADEAFAVHMTGKYPKIVVQCNPNLE